MPDPRYAARVDDTDYRPSWTKTLDSGETLREWTIVLPHMCDEWIVGDADAAQAMAADLLRLADEGPPEDRR